MEKENWNKFQAFLKILTLQTTRSNMFLRKRSIFACFGGRPDQLIYFTLAGAFMKREVAI